MGGAPWQAALPDVALWGAQLLHEERPGVGAGHSVHGVKHKAEVLARHKLAQGIKVKHLLRSGGRAGQGKALGGGRGPLARRSADAWVGGADRTTPPRPE
jgi:hypothetical protein